VRRAFWDFHRTRPHHFHRKRGDLQGRKEDGKNYTGYGPSLLTLPKFQAFIAENFAKELALLPDAVIVPSGKTAGEIVQSLHDENHISLDRCLVGFPHPSGANGHGVRFFAEGRDRWREQLQGWFS
jgi:hypothetical protein